MDYRHAIILLGVITYIAIYFLIVRPGEVNRKIYESVRVDDSETEETVEAN